MRKRTDIAIACGMVTVCFGIAAAVMYPAYRMASASVATWRELRDAVSMRDHRRIQKVLRDDDLDLHEIKDDGVFYFGHDFSARIEKSEPDFRRTFQHYLFNWRRERRNKVMISPADDGGGYAIIENGRIIFMKFP
jgi:hypothetical protein